VQAESANRTSTSGRDRPDRLQLPDDDTVAVIGGGPAGSFFALHLLDEASRLQRRLQVVIIEKSRSFEDGAEAWRCKGCNSCAGGISPRLNEVLKSSGITIPAEVVEAEIERIWLQSQWKNFPFKIPDGIRMRTVFRGSLPFNRGMGLAGFDASLLEQAVAKGAQIVQGEVRRIGRARSGRLDLGIRDSSGRQRTISAGFVVVASGINAEPAGRRTDSPLLDSICELAPRFVPVKTRKALVFELEVGREYLKRYMDGEVYFLEHGSKELSLEHIALVPKNNFLTVTLIGPLIDSAAFPKDQLRIAEQVLRMPEVAAILPNVSTTDVACACAPRMAIAPANNPYGDRIAIIGDAVGSRLYKDGLYSAFLTAKSLAGTVLYSGVDQESIAEGYDGTLKWLASDNRYGRMVFAVSRMMLGSPLASRILYQAFATELKIKDKNRRHLGMVLWQIASGMADYRDIFRRMFGLRTLRSILIGLLVTLRNQFTEVIFGLRWGSLGRYPTVIAKEQREAVKAALVSTLGIELDRDLDFERMYVIKIRSAPSALFAELGKFGDPTRSFFKIRFVKVRRIQGSPNEVGSVVRYQGWPSALALDMSLERVVPDRGLYYRVSEELADRGKLIFDVNRTKDGNSRLVIYTAFNFKKGASLAARCLWGLVRWFFPHYLHDVIWNHALCCIKAEVERQTRPL